MPIEDLNEIDRMLLRDMIEKIDRDSGKIIVVLEKLEKIPQYIPSSKEMKAIDNWSQREEDDSRKAARSLVVVILKYFEPTCPPLKKMLSKIDDEYRCLRGGIQTTVVF